MKKTQMIHSPRTFKLGLGLILAAGLVSMPVLTGASERADKKATAEMAEKARAKEKAANKKLAAAGKTASEQPTSESIMRRLASAKSKSRAKSGTKGKSMSAEEFARERIAKAESEAKKLAAKLTPTQKEKLLSLLNEAKSSQLTEIAGVGKSRSTAIEKARPIESIEDLRKVKGVGSKTYAEVVAHAKSLPRRTSKAKSSSSTKGSKKSATTKTKTKA